MNCEGKIVVVGAGAIGSHLSRLLIRIRSVRELTIIDKDFYDDSNLLSQDITPRDVGHAKARVQARALSKLRPEIRVTGIVDDIKHLPLGLFRAGVIFACVDSRIARLYINECAFRLGIPWIDAGVHADGLLARIHVYGSSPEAACLECAWDDRDYKGLEQEYACSNAGRSFRTNAPVGLGALAASLQVLEFQKLITDQWHHVAVGRQVLVDAKWHKHRVSEFRRNAKCRFDHQTWSIQRIDCPGRELTLGEAFELGRDLAPGSEELSLRVERKPFVTKFICQECALTRSVLRLKCASKPRWCSRCGREMAIAPFGLNDRVGRTALPRTMLARSLHDIGLRPGDVYTIAGATWRRHFEIPCDEAGVRND